MPVFSESKTLEDHKVGHFGYAAVKIDELEAAQFTLATIVCDRSGSTSGFQSDMEDALKASVAALKNHAMVDQILVRVVAFDNDMHEIHGFCPVSAIDETQYSGILSPGGMTALFDSVISATEATEDYSTKLDGRKFKNNAIVIVITDGANNSGRFSSDSDVVKVTEAFTSAMQRETLESMMTILVAVNWNNYKPYLEKFHADAGFTQPIIGIENATPESIARVGQFIATSVSSTSMALGTGSASQQISF